MQKSYPIEVRTLVAVLLTPNLIGSSITRNQGIIGKAVDLTLEHLADVR